MPVQMTRAEYQAKYGATPAIPTAPASTTPVQMTHAEYMAKYGGVTPTPQAPTTPPGFIDHLTNAAKSITDFLGLHQAVETTGTNFANIAHPALMEKTGGPTTNVFDNLAAGADIGLATAGSKLGEIGAVAAKDTAVGAAKGAASAVSDLVHQPIPKTVQTVLKETPAPKFDMYAQLAQKAALDNKAPTPLEFVGRLAETGLQKIQGQLDTIGAAKQQFMGSGGGAITPIKGDIVGKFYQGLQSFLNSKTAVEGDSKLFKEVAAQARDLGKTPSAGQVDKFIDFAQNKIFTAKRDLTIPVTDQGTAALRGLVSQLNTSLKKQLPDKYQQLNSQYSNLIDIRNELNTKLGAEGEKGGALMKRVFSPSDANTKQLFAKVQQLTGIDLVNEATLARYVMDVMGDPRQKSLLSQLNLAATTPTAKGILSKAVDYAMAHFNTPEEILKRARATTVGASVPAK